MAKGSGIWGGETGDDRKKTVRKSRHGAAAQLAVATLGAISPSTADAGTEITLVATGTGFVDGDAIVAGNAALVTTYVDATSLSAPFTAADADIVVRCADGDTNALAFDAVEVATVPPTTGAECLEQLKTGDTSGLAGCPAGDLKALRTGYKDWMRAEFARVEALWDTAYAAVLAEMARKGVVY